jgi:hypothetical protein
MKGRCGAFEVGERERRSGREERAGEEEVENSLLQRGLPPSEKHRGHRRRRRQSTQ